jgi:hypothetical protein
MTLAVLISQKLPPEIQAVIAKNLNQMIDDCRKRQKRNDKYAVSVGQHRVMGLHKASHKLRWYDPDPGMHRAFNFMSTVPVPYLEDFAKRILQVGKYVEEQRELLIATPEPVWLEDAVEGILQQNIVSFAESVEGFRLVDEAAPGPPMHPRYILPSARSPKQNP